jgi:hypothetical protein
MAHITQLAVLWVVYSHPMGVCSQPKFFSRAGFLSGENEGNVFWPIFDRQRWLGCGKSNFHPRIVTAATFIRRQMKGHIPRYPQTPKIRSWGPENYGGTPLKWFEGNYFWPFLDPNFDPDVLKIMPTADIHILTRVRSTHELINGEWSPPPTPPLFAREKLTFLKNRRFFLTK